jgi:hypothetical protein
MHLGPHRPHDETLALQADIRSCKTEGDATTINNPLASAICRFLDSPLPTRID